MDFSKKEQYTVFKIPKRGHRGFRQIEAPNEALKKEQRTLLHTELKKAFRISMFVHSFRSNHHVGTNAIGHLGAPYILHMDASNFFPSITYKEFCRKVHMEPDIREKIKICFCQFDGDERPRLPQGAPTSPWLSNVFLWAVDNQAANFCERLSKKRPEEQPMAYSRYADDIAISGVTTKEVYAVGLAVKKMLENVGIHCNNDKTHLIRPAERHIVCSVVCHTKVQPRRKWRRRLRAQIHNEMRDLGHLTDSSRGKLAYWNMLKETPTMYSSHQLIKMAEMSKTLTD